MPPEGYIKRTRESQVENNKAWILRLKLEIKEKKAEIKLLQKENKRLKAKKGKKK